MEGRRYVDDITAGNDGFATLCKPLEEKINKPPPGRGSRSRLGRWLPELHFLLGNHENRITRAAEDNAQLEGTVSLEHLNTRGWTVHDFLEPVNLDGVWYSHYWYQPNTGRPYTGMIETRLRQIGHTFIQGHQQGLQYGIRYVAGRAQHGVVAGSCYLHDEDYRGPQAQGHWRGILVLHQVLEGDFDIMAVSLDYLCRRYEGRPLDRGAW